ncbi:uncharacterized protein LOC126682410 isoform X2 [Mercurialis annua]|uniref:uncharacterized protein LOC126682410 isoform X2 n=1 Tax=Mercurialis annua TaxID=3986 RepID=UPI002160DC38|nr:uncharacterized protein LOC126682410 isoform X2 [Mercurialis annua]
MCFFMIPLDFSLLKFKGCADAKKVIAALKSRGISVVGAAGFCWGGMVVVKLSSGDDIQAAVILHPDWITADEINSYFCLRISLHHYSMLHENFLSHAFRVLYPLLKT